VSKINALSLSTLAILATTSLGVCVCVTCVPHCWRASHAEVAFRQILMTLRRFCVTAAAVLVCTLFALLAGPCGTPALQGITPYIPRLCRCRC